MVRLLCANLLLLPFLAWAALPPGYEDKLLCPEHKCRRPNSAMLQSATTGKRSLYWECVFTDNRGGQIAVTPWGPRTGERYQELLDAGYHDTICPPLDIPAAAEDCPPLSGTQNKVACCSKSGCGMFWGYSCVHVDTLGPIAQASNECPSRRSNEL